jgi:hypothetical protein
LIRFRRRQRHLAGQREGHGRLRSRQGRADCWGLRRRRNADGGHQEADEGPARPYII